MSGTPNIGPGNLPTASTMDVVSLGDSHYTAALSKRAHIAVALPALKGGGMERVMLTLAHAFAQAGHRVDLVICELKGPYVAMLPSSVNLVPLQQTSYFHARMTALAADIQTAAAMLKPVLLPISTPVQLRTLPSLARYLEAQAPDAIVSCSPHLNLAVLWAKRLAAVSTRVIVTQHTMLSYKAHPRSYQKKWRWRFLLPLLRRVLPRANAIVAVSEAVAADLVESLCIAHERITTIYNPVVDRALFDRARAPLQHPWFRANEPPVVLGVGRLVAVKDFPTLLRAFARLRSHRPARLMLLGEGDERQKLELLIDQLDMRADCCLVGQVGNPFAYMARAKVLVLSSSYEGFGNVLVEALACGCPVVSTDCPGGAVEILQNGRYGLLVPAGDDAAMAKAIETTLDRAPERQTLQTRSLHFSVDRAVQRYSEVLLGLRGESG